MLAFRSRIGLLWPVLGMAGSIAIAIAATKVLNHRPVPWWWRIPLPGGHMAAVHLFWAGVIVLCVAWLGVGRRIASVSRTPVRDVLVIAAAWALPLVLGPALFSLDVYSYLAQGALLHHGLNPYRVAPIALRRWHEHAILTAVSTNWRHTTAPYGPLFMAIAALVAGIAGTNVMLGVMLLRLVELAGLALVAVFLPRLARALGADPARALWLALCSPLTLLYLVGGAHNDALMIGLLVAGVTLAVERRPLTAIAICSVAATVKLPAIAAVAMIAVCWLRAEPAHRPRVIASTVAVCGSVVLVVGLLAGVGVSWISGSLFSTPETVRIALTPATAFGVALAHALHGAGVSVDARGLEDRCVQVATWLVALVAVWLCVRVRYDRLVRYLAALLLLAAVGGPIAWPWYLLWGAVLLAADPVLQRSWWLAGALIAGVFFVMPGGQVATPLPQAPRVLELYLLAGALALLLALRRRGSRRPAPPVLRLPGVAEAGR